MLKNINSLEDLKQEKKNIKMTMAVTKDAFAKNLGTNRKELKDFLLQKIAIPAGGVGLGTIAVNQLTKSKPSPKKIEQESTLGSILSSFLPIALNLIQAYFLEQQNEIIEEQ